MLEIGYLVPGTHLQLYKLDLEEKTDVFFVSLFRDPYFNKQPAAYEGRHSVLRNRCYQVRPEYLDFHTDLRRYVL